MAKSNTFENNLLELIFKGTAITGLARDAAAPLTNLYVSLHTADPGEAGFQNTSEAAYTGYARKAVARPAGWTVTGNSVSPAATISFPIGTGGSGTATHWGVGTDISGAGKLLYRGLLSPKRTLGNGITPKLTTATAISEN